MTSMDRRTLLTALLGACAATGAVGALSSTAAAVPRPAPRRADTDPVAEAVPEAAEGEARLHNAQFIVVRRRPRRRWFWRRRVRRRRVFIY